jgi:uncharacterized integral membrane protein
MIRRIAAALILVPLAILLVSLAVANRQSVVISFDPFDPAHPALTQALPLYLLMLMILIGGVLLGGSAARLADAQRRELHVEVDRLRRRLGSPAVAAQAAPAEAGPRLSIPPPAA